MARDQGYLYVLAIAEHAEIVDVNLKSPLFSAIETSTDGKLGYIRVPNSVSRINIPSGTAIRVPVALGSKLAQSKRWRTISADDFYRRGSVMPDAYDLLARIERLREGLPEDPDAAPEPDPEPEPEDEDEDEVDETVPEEEPVAETEPSTDEE